MRTHTKARFIHLYFLSVQTSLIIAKYREFQKKKKLLEKESCFTLAKLLPNKLNSHIFFVLSGHPNL